MKLCITLWMLLTLNTAFAQKNYRPFTKQQDQWIQLASAEAEKGNLDSMRSLGTFLANIGYADAKTEKKYPFVTDINTGVALLTKCAGAGDAGCMYRLYYYYQGSNIQAMAGWADSAKYYHDKALIASQDPDPGTMFFLGEKMLGINKNEEYDREKAKAWFQKAAAVSYAPAQKKMNMFTLAANTPYEKGVHAYKAGDIDSAFIYWQADAIINHNSESMFQLGSLYYIGADITKKEQREMYLDENLTNPGFNIPTRVGLTGLAWFSRSANYNNPSAHMMLAEIDSKARLADAAPEHLKAAADLGNSEAAAIYSKAIKIKNDALAARKEAALQQEKDAALERNRPKGKSWKVCTTCYGSGTIRNPIQSSLEQDKNGRWHTMGTQYMSCWTCNGKGYIDH